MVIQGGCGFDVCCRGPQGCARWAGEREEAAGKRPEDDAGRRDPAGPGRGPASAMLAVAQRQLQPGVIRIKKKDSD